MTQCPRHFLLSHPDANAKHKASLMKIILALLLTALVAVASPIATQRMIAVVLWQGLIDKQ